MNHAIQPHAAPGEILLSAGLIAVACLQACQSPTMPMNPPTHAQPVEVENFGTLADGREARSFTLRNAAGTTAVLTDFGATLVSFEFADRSGQMADVVLGFDDVSGYEGDGNQYFGCIAGRVANRIANATFELDGETYSLPANNDPHTLHGGDVGFGRRLWSAEVGDGGQVTFQYASPSGEEGFPGALRVAVTYTLTDENELRLEYRATADAPTLCNLTHHSYFNLGGHGSGPIAGHELQINADAFTPADDTLIPTGELRDVEGTVFDFRKARSIGAHLDEVTETPALGYDHNYVLRGDAGAMAAELHDPSSGRTLQIYTDQPGLQFYSGNFLFDQPGKDGKSYALRSACCLETQAFPAAPSHAHFPSIVLRPGETYSQTTVHRFFTR